MTASKSRIPTHILQRIRLQAKLLLKIYIRISELTWSNVVTSSDEFFNVRGYHHGIFLVEIVHNSTQTFIQAGYITIQVYVLDTKRQYILVHCFIKRTGRNLPSPNLLLQRQDHSQAQIPVQQPHYISEDKTANSL
jgi:hypothetical protein